MNDADIKKIIRWGATIVLLCAFWPAGLFLLFYNLRRTPNNRNSGSYSGTNAGTYSRVTKTDDSAYGHVNHSGRYSDNASYSHGNFSTNTTTGSYTTPPSVSAKKEKPKPTAVGATLLLIAAVLLFLIGLSKLGGLLDEFSIRSLLGTLFYLVGGGASLFGSFTLRRNIKRYQKYLSVMGVDDAKSVQEISTATGVRAAIVRKDLDYMAGRGYFGPDAYFDIGLDSIVISQEAAENERNIRYAQETAQPEVQKDKYSQALSRLHDLSRSISDQTIYEKASKIEELTGKIFKIAQSNPEKEPEIRKFFEYYLPSTEKLLRSYSMLEKQGVQGGNISNTKHEIERILDTLIVGYEKQIDKLFSSDAIDISSDIDVLETMLKQDGLAGETLGGH